MRLSGMIGLAMLGGALSLPSCGGDDDPSGAGGTGGKGGSSGKGGTAGKATGGSAGKATGGSAGKATGGSAGKATGGSSGSSSGEAGEAGSGGGAGTPGSGGSSGEAGSGGTGGSGGSSAGESGAGGAGGEPGNPPDLQSTACSAFPATVTLGESIQLNTFGAVLCEATSPSACRLTTNTYSNGVNPCEEADRIAVFLGSTSNNTLTLPDSWHITSTTAGTIDSSFDYYMSAIPAATSVTATLESPGGDTYSLVFTFGAGRSFTITSFTETT